MALKRDHLNGRKGSVWLNSEGVLQAQPPRCENVVSTVGAGDSNGGRLNLRFQPRLE